MVDGNVIVQITNEFAARNTTGSSMHLSELYKRRVQTIERILNERIKVEGEYPLELADEEV